MARRRRSTGRRKKLNPRTGGCGGKGYAGFGRKISIKTYMRRKPGTAKTAKKTVRVSASAYCSSRRVSTTRATSQKGKPCFTKTGIQKSALKSGNCPKGLTRSQSRKDAHTARTGGYRKKGGAARHRRSRR